LPGFVKNWEGARGGQGGEDENGPGEEKKDGNLGRCGRKKGGTELKDLKVAWLANVMEKILSCKGKKKGFTRASDGEKRA